MQDTTLIGEVFGNWTVICPGQKPYHYLCRCVCGLEKEVYKYTLTSGISKRCSSCSNTTHGYSRKNNSIYRAWCKMKGRCTNPNETGYYRYGGRGIKVCDRWMNSFEAFLEDMGERPGPEYSLDRIDNDGDYTPENCRWATREEQNNNQSRNRLITHNGKTQTLAQWAKEIGMHKETLRSRIYRYGWPVSRALTEPINISKRRS